MSAALASDHISSLSSTSRQMNILLFVHTQSEVQFWWLAPAFALDKNALSSQQLSSGIWDAERDKDNDDDDDKDNNNSSSSSSNLEAQA